MSGSHLLKEFDVFIPGHRLKQTAYSGNFPSLGLTLIDHSIDCFLLKGRGPQRAKVYLQRQRLPLILFPYPVLFFFHWIVFVNTSSLDTDDLRDLWLVRPITYHKSQHKWPQSSVSVSSHVSSVTVWPHSVVSCNKISAVSEFRREGDNHPWPNKTLSPLLYSQNVQT